MRLRKFRHIVFLSRRGSFLIAVLMLCAKLMTVASGSALAADDVPALDAIVCVGEGLGQKVDLVKTRGTKPTVYMFLQKEHWDRPTARLLRELDLQIRDKLTDGGIVAVWLTDEPVQGLQEHLPRVQQSIKLSMTTYAVWPGNAFGPPDWGLTRDDHVTIVSAKGGKVIRRHTFRSTNDGDAPKVLADFGL
ncbi:hypothetical protein GC170_07340 [bacterium]|nr:hypothetical protein [bacterium]